MNDLGMGRLAWNLPTWRVRKKLERNRALLRTLRAKNWMAAEEVCQWLTRRGFDFQYHTHLCATEDGRVAVMCFDEGYTIDGGHVCPILREKKSTLSTPRGGSRS